MCQDGPQPPPDVSWIEFDYWGITGLGRHRTVDGEGNVIDGPKPWPWQRWFR